MYHVIAGKYDSYGENVKFADAYRNIAEAMAVAETLKGYHFVRIEEDDGTPIVVADAGKTPPLET